MNPKFLFFAVFVFICSYSFAQNSLASTATTTPFKQCNSISEKASEKNATMVYSNREWRKIKKEMKENRKKRMASAKNEAIIPKRILDTIVLEAPNFTGQSQLSSW